MQEMPRSYYWLSKVILTVIKIHEVYEQLSYHYNSLSVGSKCPIFNMEKAVKEVTCFSPDQGKLNIRTESLFVDL